MTARTAPAPATPAWPALAALLWLGVAIAAGFTGILARVPSPGPQLLILTLAAVTVAAGTRPGALRTWIDRVDLRWLVAPHVLRLVAGADFLVLAGRGELSPLFARNGGWGDIATAVLAMILLAFGLPRTRGHRTAWLLWNAFGALDFVIVLGTASVVALTDRPSLAPLFHLPLALIPVYAVPLLIASHVFLFRRLLQERAEA